jgi:hypothetical protein
MPSPDGLALLQSPRLWAEFYAFGLEAPGWTLGF